MKAQSACKVVLVLWIKSNTAHPPITYPKSSKKQSCFEINNGFLNSPFLGEFEVINS